MEQEQRVWLLSATYGSKHRINVFGTRERAEQAELEMLRINFSDYDDNGFDAATASLAALRAVYNQEWYLVDWGYDLRETGIE